jgi:hypothetical protein
LIDVTIHPEGPATGQLDMGFIGFPFDMVPKFQAATLCFSRSSLDTNSSKFSSVAVEATQIISPYYEVDINSKDQ